MTPGLHEEEAIGKVYDVELIRRLWPFLRPHWRLMLLVIGLVPLLALLDALPGPLIGAGLDYLAGVEGKVLWSRVLAQPPEGIGVIPWLALVLLCSVALQTSVQFAHWMALKVMGQRATRELRTVLFDHVQRLPLSFFDRYPVGRLVTRLSNDVESLGEMFSGGLIALFTDVVLMLVFATLLFWIDWRLAGVALAVVPILAVVAFVLRWQVRQSFRIVRIKIAQINAQLQETISGMRVVQLFARERRNMRDFSAINGEHRDAWFRYIRFDVVLSATIELSTNLTTALILWYGARRLGVDDLSLGVLYIFVDWMRRFFHPIQNLAARYSVMQGSMAALERIFELLDYAAEPAEAAAEPLAVRGEIVAVRGEIVFENVSFAYTDEPVLKNVSFRVAAGERIALVGHTGAGKTTVLKLLARLYEPDAGRILLDGVDIREIPRTELRRHLAFVLQDVFLFTGDLASNISLGRADISQAEIEDAARTVHLEGLVRRLPHGYGQQVHERGLNFSGGERQLLSFARALAQRPQVLLLDEATASVDTETEALIKDALHQLIEDKTSIVVAHRLSTIRDVDRIYVLHHGELREVGTHATLLAERGLYWRLYKLQYAAQEAA